MTLKKTTFVGVIFIFLIGFLIHYLYDWFPSIVTLILSPINESVWEHQKLIFTSYLLWGIVEYFILKRYNLYSKNIIISTVFSSIFNMSIFSGIYTPIYVAFGENLFVTLFIYLCTIIATQFVSYYILNTPNNRVSINIVSIAMIPLIWFFFAYLSYNPILYNPLFFDPNSGTYGLDEST